MQHECGAPVSNYDVRVHCANTQIKRTPSAYASLLCDMLIIDWFNRHHLNFISKPPESFSTLPSTRFLSLSMKYHYASIKFFFDDFIMIKSVLIDGWCWLIELWSFTVPPRPQLLAAADTRQPARTVPSLVQPSRLDRISALKICFTRSTFLLCSCFNFRYTEVVPCTYMNREFRKIS